MKLDLMFKKILRIPTYNWDGDGDNICGDGVGMGTLVIGMGPGWGGDGVVSSSPCQYLITKPVPLYASFMQC